MLFYDVPVGGTQGGTKVCICMYITHSSEKQDYTIHSIYRDLNGGCLTFVYSLKLRQGPIRLFDMGGEACWPGLKRIGDVYSDFKIHLTAGSQANLYFMTFPSLYSTELIRPLVHRRS